MDNEIGSAALSRLNAPGTQERLAALEQLIAETDFPAPVPQYVNNHIHTFYSFSPYSPSAAVYFAKRAGLCTAGIVDHDTLAGAREFLAAAEIAGLPVTVGMECRVSMRGTGLERRRTNNPDQTGISYMTLQSIPHARIEELTRFFQPCRQERNRRNEKMTKAIQALLPEAKLDFARDVLPLSRHGEGGTVTERHILYALALRLEALTGRGAPLLEKLAGVGVALTPRQKAQMLDRDNPFYTYDLLGILKGSFLPLVYVDAAEECPALEDMVHLSRDVDALLCYAYLGDVGESVTGDKRPQKFEDDYLEELFQCLYDAGVRAITYMPARNSRRQLERLRSLCDRWGMFQVSGEDINSPRQSFVCPAMKDPLFQNLIDATWCLIEHEQKETPLPIGSLSGKENFRP